MKLAKCLGCGSSCFREERTQNTGVRLEIGINRAGNKSINNVVPRDRSIRIAPEIRYFCEKCGDEVWISEDNYEAGGLKV